MFRLHTDGFAGLYGELFLATMALLFVIAIVSGVALYGPFMKKLPFGTVRKEKSARLKWLDGGGRGGLFHQVRASLSGREKPPCSFSP